ncbi:hypothetical protein [Bradyrhizobium sp. WSM2254]|nr:hypothetical protein [Bradyrhizobium sp. WSM2254]
MTAALKVFDDMLAHIPQEQGFVGHLLRRLSALRLNAGNLT